MQSGEQLSLTTLLARVDAIEIPILQRDYAQGRPEAADVRANFLGALREALLSRDATQPLNLDFVYGSVLRKEKSVLSVLDGQQRLTTLFLLHWYMGVRDGALDSFLAVFRNGTRSKFRYCTRPSAGEFLDALVNARMSLDDIPPNPKALANAIVDARWFFLAWQKDPTVQSCLVMLDAIHQTFHAEDDLYARLVDEQNPRITFHFLELTEFGLSDDLYIKMNARGKPLTAFENFKAWLVTRVDASAPADFALRVDVEWTDFFWHLAEDVPTRQGTTSTHDELFLRFLYIMAFFEACERLEGGFWSTANTRAAARITLLRNARGYVSLRSFEDHAAYTATTVRDTALLLDYFCDAPEAEDRQLLQRCLSGQERHDDLVKLYSVLCLLRAARNATTTTSMVDARVRWARVTSNLINNSRIDELSSVALALQGLRTLESNALFLYEALVAGLKIGGLSQEQLREEIYKATLIEADSAWEAVLPLAEKHSYLQGRVGFLLDASKGALDLPDPQRFAAYASKASVLLANKMLHSQEFLLQRALLSLGNYLVPKGGGRFTFCAPLTGSYRERSENWLQVVGQPVFRQLLDLIGDDVEASLRALISGANCTDWRRYVIRMPKLIAYCGEAYLVQKYENADGKWTMYLMSKSRMSGYYSEVRTRALYLALKNLQNKNDLPSGISAIDYEEVYGGLAPALVVQAGRALKIRYDGMWACFDEDLPCKMPEGLSEILALSGFQED
jgi:hypothetical protein